MKCKHADEHVVIKYDCDGLPDPLELSWRECLDCDEWLPMGQANDSPPEVQIEIRAAEIAAGWSCNAEEYDGDAGYLARCIVGPRLTPLPAETHKEG